jgi:hypothetical protein
VIGGWSLVLQFASDAVGSAVDEAIGTVEGVKGAAHWDRECWEILGQFSPEQMMIVVGDAVELVQVRSEDR